LAQVIIAQANLPQASLPPDQQGSASYPTG